MNGDDGRSVTAPKFPICPHLEIPGHETRNGDGVSVVILIEETVVHDADTGLSKCLKMIRHVYAAA